MLDDKRNIKKTILETIKSKKSGIKAKQIRELTGFTGKQISNNVFHLKKEKLVRKTPKGFFVYIPPKEPSINSDLDSK
jgi:predicted transcriptional regulator